MAPLTPSEQPADRDARPPANPPRDFIRRIVAKHVAESRFPKIRTRFPPEPNGYLHIGHAKSICINFGIAREFDGICNIRMDDTNPAKEELEYVSSIRADVAWLIRGWADHCAGFKPKGRSPEARPVDGRDDFYLEGLPAGPAGGEEPLYASDYFDQLYYYAVQLIRKGLAYVCDLTPEQTDQYRGAPDRPGRDSPGRKRSVAANLDLFGRMKNGEFPDGARTLRARIDMASPNVWLRDPVLYRIRHLQHHHTGDKWCVYPMYDFAHCLSDYIEGITHSICTLEFEVHRPLYDWFLINLDLPRPRPTQYEFSRLMVTYTVLSKRKLMQLVKDKHVEGWDDPRMPTLAGLRRRGVPPEALRAFALGVGVTKYNGVTDVGLLERAVREDLNRSAPRRLVVLRPLRLVLTNYPAGHVEEFEARNNPEDPAAGSRRVPFSRELFIDEADFQENPPPGYFRLSPGAEVRLKFGYLIRCDEVIKDKAGKIVELRCRVDLASLKGGGAAARKVKGTLHWVSAAHCFDAEVRLYRRLFTVPDPDLRGNFKAYLNRDSLEVLRGKCEACLASALPNDRFQFERVGYFVVDTASQTGKPVFNLTVLLRDKWTEGLARRSQAAGEPLTAGGHPSPSGRMRFRIG